MRHVYIIVFLFLLVMCLYGQGMNDWKTITYMNDVTDLVHHKDDIWVATTGGVYRFDPVDSTHVFFNNLDGLGSIDMTTIDKDVYNRIIAGSRDGTINRYDPESDHWTVYRNLSGEEITDIYTIEDTLWVATNNGVGVYLIHPDNLEFRDFYNNLPLTSDKSYRISVYNKRVFYATKNGLIQAPSNFIKNNLKIAEAWKTITVSDGLPWY